MSAIPIDDLQDEGADKRAAPRTRTLKRAKVLFNNHFSTFDCIVRNISATGALLTLDESAHLPKEFDVRIGDEKTERPARLVYRRGVLAGIRFTDIPDEDGTPPAPPAPAADPIEAAPQGSIRRILPDALPPALTRRFRWT